MCWFLCTHTDVSEPRKMEDRCAKKETTSLCRLAIDLDRRERLSQQFSILAWRRKKGNSALYAEATKKNTCKRSVCFTTPPLVWLVLRCLEHEDNLFPGYYSLALSEVFFSKHVIFNKYCDARYDYREFWDCTISERLVGHRRQIYFFAYSKSEFQGIKIVWSEKWWRCSINSFVCYEKVWSRGFTQSRHPVN